MPVASPEPSHHEQHSAGQLRGTHGRSVSGVSALSTGSVCHYTPPPRVALQAPRAAARCTDVCRPAHTITGYMLSHLLDAFLEEGPALPRCADVLGPAQVIVDYLLDQFPEETRDLVPHSAAERARCRVPVRMLDVYITPIQACPGSVKSSAPVQPAWLVADCQLPSPTPLSQSLPVANAA